MKIEITDEDIRLGQACSCFSCPIARAVSRQFPDDFVMVNRCNIVVESDNFEKVVYPLSQEARKFVSDFDSGHPVAPFTLVLENGL